MKKYCLGVVLICSVFFLKAQDSAFDWIIGSWEGPGFGGHFEEVWSKPDKDGNLMGMFRYSTDEGVGFYEFWILSRKGMKLRHFNPDFTAWEAKDDWVNFEMIEYDEKLIRMKGLVYELTSDNELKITLKLKEGDEIKTEIFQLKRVE
jgi:hypothetical protein